MLLVCMAFLVWDRQDIAVDMEVEILEWDTFYSFLNELSSIDQIKMKLFLKLHPRDFSQLAQGNYVLSGDYNKTEFVNLVLAGPPKVFKSFTILEGWSTYDIDAQLTQKGLIDLWAYLTLVEDKKTINFWTAKYEFLERDLDSLEGFLYPDTYLLDVGQPFLEQLVDLQLQAFQKKVWSPYEEQITTLGQRLAQDNLNVDLDWYGVLTLASVVEKEERQAKNKPVVAWIFLNRLDQGMRLDADITLCYGLEEPYETCTPDVIVQKIYDEDNPFNTRQQAWLPPQVIANPSAETIAAVLNYELTDYFYYLHDSQGRIHYGKTVGEHGNNKRKYLGG